MERNIIVVIHLGISTINGERKNSVRKDKYGTLSGDLVAVFTHTSNDLTETIYIKRILCIIRAYFFLQILLDLYSNKDVGLTDCHQICSLYKLPSRK